MLYDLPTTPGALLGHRKDGTPFYLIAGGSEPTPEPAPEGDPASDPAPAPEPQPEPAKADPEPTPSVDPKEPAGEGDDGGHSAKVIAAIRQDFKTERQKRQAAEAEAKKQADEFAAFRTEHEQRMDALAKALGVKKDDAPPDPKELMDKLTASQQETQRRAAEKREADVMLAVYRAAGKHGADADALLDSRAFAAKVNNLDPAAEDFADRLGEAITETVESSDRYKAPAPVTPPPKPKGPKTSGGEFTGSPGGTKPISEAELEGMSPEEISKAFADGRLQHLM